jgi:hypothetical protein
MGGRSKLQKNMLGIAMGMGGTVSFSSIRRWHYRDPGVPAAASAVSRAARELAELGLVCRSRDGIQITNEGRSFMRAEIDRAGYHLDFLINVLRSFDQGRVSDLDIKLSLLSLSLEAQMKPGDVIRDANERVRYALKRWLKTPGAEQQIERIGKGAKRS